MTSHELRSAFIQYFTERGHRRLPAASLIPDRMSTTLFTIAGMEQFVPVFLGEQPPPAPRAVTVQPCLRVAGAKSDVENVGRTGRHGTFLEMLGNFSFGDYYKREAIFYAWEFVTETLTLERDRIAVTVHTSDDEAARIWQSEIGLQPERITRFDQDNFWTMGPTGPCGPCTEIFYDTGESHASGPTDTGPNLGDRFVEIWNLVFQQYNRDEHGNLTQLPRKSIDTGAGFERMLAVVNGKVSMYETDLFTDLIAAQPAVGTSNLTSPEQCVRRNIIADHGRAATFLINDSVHPSNTERGYVLRFLIRRAIRNGRLLGYPNGFLSALVPSVVQSLASGYPQLRENMGRIQDVLRKEEQTFERTLERGSEMLAQLIERARDEQTCRIAGRDAFTLHDTYGFPIELTREIAQERGVAVDSAEFDAAMVEQRTRARADAKAKRSTVAVSDMPGLASDFLGYEGLEAEGEILALMRAGQPVVEINEGEEAQVVLDKTAFYAEKGGQIGDRGTINVGENTFEVFDTQYLGEAIAHHGMMRAGALHAGERALTSVSAHWREEIRRHHTSAHLLQRALKDVLGDEVAQAGSWVGTDRMRFDFHSPAALSPEQRHDVSRRVNQMIREDTPLVTEVLPIAEARARGAISMAGEKYGDCVRVVKAGSSVEFCGGTHAHSTGELGLFIILSESSIGSGIRRIESVVSRAAEGHVERQQALVGQLSETLSAKPDELTDRVARLQQDMRELQTAVGELKARLAASDAQTYVDRVENLNGKPFLGALVHEADAEALKRLANAIRQRLGSGVVALAGLDNGTVSLLVSASDDMVELGVHAGNLLKTAAPLVEGRGGGAATQAQGGGKKVAAASEAIAAIRTAVSSMSSTLRQARPSTSSALRQARPSTSSG